MPFNNGLEQREKYDVLGEYRILDGGILIPLNGMWYFSSENIHCEYCLHKSNKGETTCYYHSIAAGIVVKPGTE
jgi:hypothetical protein